MRWRLILEEFGPELKYIKGKNNIVDNGLSRHKLKETEFSLEALVFDEEDFPESYPLSFKQIASEQLKDPNLQAKLKEPGNQYRTEKIQHSSFEYSIIVNGEGKIALPPKL